MKTDAINRQWLLARRPSGMVEAGDFQRVDAALPVADLAAGEILVRNIMLGFDPAQRGWMDDAPGYMPPIALGEPVRGSAAARIVASENPDFPVGALVRGLFGWQDYAVANRAGDAPPLRAPDGLSPQHALGMFGGASLTAHVGLLEVGALRDGETVLVSGAAGAVGSMAVQIAKLKGARVIGIAGGAEKCGWLTEEYGADAAIDYKSENVAQRLTALCPNGIDLFFDNVGGTILEAGIGNIALFGRIVLCGAISGYNDATPSPGPRNLMNLVTQRATMRGFILLDHLDCAPAAMAEFADWVESARIRYREDIQQGFENIPRSFLRLFRGENRGKQLLRIDDVAELSA